MKSRACEQLCSITPDSFPPPTLLPPQVTVSPFGEATSGAVCVCVCWGGYGWYIAFFLCQSFLFMLILCSSTGSLQAAVPSGISICYPLTIWLLFFSFLNTFSPRHHHLRWGAQPCPWVGQLELFGTSCVQHRASPTSPHRGRPWSPQLAALGYPQSIHQQRYAVWVKVKVMATSIIWRSGRR